MNADNLNFKNIWKPFLIAAALAFVYATVLTKLGSDWWTDDNYSHGLLVPFVIGYIVYLEFDELKKTASNQAFWLGGALVCIAFTLLLGGTLGAELFTQRISFVVMLAGIVVYFFGAKITRLLVVPFALLLFSIPIPQIIFNRIAFPLQIYASQMAVWGIRLFGVPSVRKGNVIEILPNGATQIVALEVVEACSGIRSLMTLVTLALVLWYFTRAKRRSASNGGFGFFKTFDFWRAIILMLSAVPIAIFTNAGRVAATGVLTYYWGKRATAGALHEASGWLVYVAALGLLLGLNFVLKKFQTRDAEAQSEKISRPKAENPRPPIANSFYVLCAALIVGGLLINWFNQRGEAEVSRKPLAEIPMRLGDWRQKGPDIRFSRETEAVLRTTDYMMRDYAAPDGRTANLYVGYYASQKSGATYHSPQNCLPGAGWVMTQPELIEIKTASGKTFTANKFIVENGIYREVLIYWYQGRGRFTASEYADKINTIRDSVLRRRSDGAMVRVMTSVAGSESEATAEAADLAAQTADRLPEFIPE